MLIVPLCRFWFDRDARLATSSGFVFSSFTLSFLLPSSPIPNPVYFESHCVYEPERSITALSARTANLNDSVRETVGKLKQLESQSPPSPTFKTHLKATTSAREVTYQKSPSHDLWRGGLERRSSFWTTVVLTLTEIDPSRRNYHELSTHFGLSLMKGSMFGEFRHVAEMHRRRNRGSLLNAEEGRRRPGLNNLTPLP